MNGKGVGVDTFNPMLGRQEKQRSRDEDVRRLLSGEVDRESLRRENGFFSSLRIVEVVIRNRRYRLKTKTAPEGAAG